MALAVLMPVLSAALLIAWWRGWLPRRVWLVAVALQLVLVASALLALRTGEIDEERVEKVLASEAPIEAHEEAAEVFMWTSAGVLVLFLAGALIRKERAAQLLATTAVAGTVLVFTMGYRVGQAGGELVYRHGAANAYVEPAAPSVSAGAEKSEHERQRKRAPHDKDDDDHDDDDHDDD
jgi:hypothetical protein